MRGLKVLSLFDGISCGQIALERVGIRVDKYFASEIKNIAIKTTMMHYPNTIQVGDVTKLSYKDGVLYSENGEYNIGHIDILIGGSPCQDFSAASILTPYKDYNNNYGLNGLKSRLFYEYLRLKNEINPTYFLLENVKMKKDSEKQLNEYMGVDGIHIDSSLVSYQKRKRIYWTNIPNIHVPNDKNINFQDYKDTNEKRLEEAKMKPTPSRVRMWNNGVKECLSNCPNITFSEKINCLTRKQDRCPNSGLIAYKNFARYLTRREMELAQTLPEGYLDNLSFLQVQDVCGDGWTVDVIAHIFKGLKEELESQN